jgi:predicted DNA binding CopG/RHH family protein
MVQPEELGIKQLNAFGIFFEDGSIVPLRLNERDWSRLKIVASRKRVPIQQFITQVFLDSLGDWHDSQI